MSTSVWFIEQHGAGRQGDRKGDRYAAAFASRGAGGRPLLPPASAVHRALRVVLWPPAPLPGGLCGLVDLKISTRPRCARWVMVTRLVFLHRTVPAASWREGIEGRDSLPKDAVFYRRGWAEEKGDEELAALGAGPALAMLSTPRLSA